MICPDCAEYVAEYRYHPGCCPHEEVEHEDEGVMRWYCLQCGAAVYPDEDGWAAA